MSHDHGTCPAIIGYGQGRPRETMHELTKETAAFTHEQRRTLAGYVSDHMAATDTAMAVAGKGTKLQNNPHLAVYLSERRWQRLLDPTVDFDANLEEMSDAMLQIGCKNPNASTVKFALAICAMCHDMKLDPSEAYHQGNKLKVKLTETRKLNPSIQQTYKAFPADPQDFVRYFPTAFPAAEPPVASKLDASGVHTRTRKDVMPARSSNKAYVDAVGKGDDKRTTARSSNDMVDSCMRFMFGMAQQNPFFAQQSPLARQTTPLALCDGTLAATPPPSRAPSPISSRAPSPISERGTAPALVDRPSTVATPSTSDIIAQAKLALEKKRAAKGKPKGKKGHADEDAESNVSIDEDDESCDHDSPTPPRKRIRGKRSAAGTPARRRKGPPKAARDKAPKAPPKVSRDKAPKAPPTTGKKDKGKKRDAKGRYIATPP